MNPALALQASTLADPNTMPGAQMPGQPPAQPSAVVPQDVTLKLAAGTTDTSKGPTTTQVVPTPEINQNVAAIAQSGVDEVAAQEKLKATAVANEQLEAKSAADRAALAAQTEKDREEARQWKEVELPKRTAAWEAAQAEAEKKATMTTLWQDMSTPRKLLTAVGVGLGAAASSYNHGPNQAYEIYRDAENAHRQAAESELQNAVRKAQEKGASVEQVTKLFTGKIEDLDHREIAKDALLIKQLEALKKTNPTAAANADITISKIREGKAQKELDARMALAQHRTNEGSIHTVTSSESTPTAGGGSENKAGDAMRDAALLQARGGLEELAKTGGAGKSAREKALTNQESIDRAHKQSETTTGAAVNWVARGVGAVPTEPLAGINPKDKTALQAERMALGYMYDTVAKGAGNPEARAAAIDTQSRLLQSMNTAQRQRYWSQRLEQVNQAIATLPKAAARMTGATGEQPSAAPVPRMIRPPSIQPSKVLKMAPDDARAYRQATTAKPGDPLYPKFQELKRRLDAKYGAAQP